MHAYVYVESILCFTLVAHTEKIFFSKLCGWIPEICYDYLYSASSSLF